MRLFIVSYDIRSDVRRADVAACLESWGRRIQYSVFECLFSDVQLAMCRTELDNVIHHDDDQILFIDVGPREGRAKDAIEALGKPYKLPNRDAIIV